MAEIPPLPRHLTLQVVTPDRSVVTQEVDEVQIPGADGYFDVLPGHTPLLAALKIGELWYRKGGQRHYLSVIFGFAEVLPDRVTILAQLAELPDEIDVARAEAARKRAEQRLAQPTMDLDFERARIALMKALIRIQVGTKARPLASVQ
jgi:F-type H+-transporting ATPase subunit epsilon